MKNSYFSPSICEKILEYKLCEHLGKLDFPYITEKDEKNVLLPRKQAFSNIKDVLFQLLDKSILSLFKEVKIKEQETLVLFTWVIPSGLGDLSMQIHIANIIQKKLPHINIELISIVEKTAIIPPTLTSTLPHHILHYSHPKEALISKEILLLLQKAFCIIEIPTPYFGMDTLKQTIQYQKEKCPIIARIGEYGFLDSKEYNPSTRNRSMGLHPLEKGIISLEKAKKINRDNNTYFAYLITKEGVSAYLLTILMSRKDDKEDLIIIIPNLERVIAILKTIDFKSFGIKSVEVIDDINQASIDVQKNGKTLKIEQKKNLTPNLIKDYMRSCNAFVGVRGDGSFTEVITTDAVFFYDALDHALPFLCDLFQIVKNHFFAYFSLYNFIKAQIENKMDPYKRAEILSECLLDKTLFIGMKKLLYLLHERYSFNDSLINLIKQSYSFYQNPSLKRELENNLTLFTEKKIPLKTMLSPHLFDL